MATYIPELDAVTERGKALFLVSVLHIEGDKRHSLYPMPTTLNIGLQKLAVWFQRNLKPGDALSLEGVSFSAVEEVLESLKCSRQ